VLVLLDTRIQRMPYGRIFLDSLPPYRMTQDLKEVRRFLESSPEQRAARSASRSR